MIHLVRNDQDEVIKINISMYFYILTKYLFFNFLRRSKQFTVKL